MQIPGSFKTSIFGSRSPSEVPRIQLQDEWFVDVAKSVGAEVNRTLRILQDVACNGNLKEFLLVCNR